MANEVFEKADPRSIPIRAQPNDPIVGMDELGRPMYRTMGGVNYSLQYVNRAGLEERYPSVLGTAQRLYESLEVPTYEEFVESIPTLSEATRKIQDIAVGSPKWLTDVAVDGLLGLNERMNKVLTGEATMDDVLFLSLNTAGAGATAPVPSNSLRVFGGRRALDTPIPKTDGQVLGAYRSGLERRIAELQEAGGVRHADNIKYLEEILGEAMSPENMDPDILWDETGMFKLPDNNWRFVIDSRMDKPSPVGEQALEAIQLERNMLMLRKTSDQPGWIRVDEAQQARINITLKDMLGEESEILRHYPELSDMNLTLTTATDDLGYNGFYKGVNEGIELVVGDNGFDENTQHYFYHEIQHAIQEIEGFDAGSNPLRFQGDNAEFLRDIDTISSMYGVTREIQNRNGMIATINETTGDVMYVTPEGKNIINTGLTGPNLKKFFNHPDPAVVTRRVEHMLANAENLADGMNRGLTPWQMYARTVGELEAETAGYIARYVRKEGELPEVAPDILMEEELQRQMGGRKGIPMARSPGQGGPR